MEENSINSTPILFGILPEDIERWKSGFSAEMHKYKCSSYWNVPISLNILHVSTNLDAVSDITAKITNFLELRGFSNEHIPNPNWADADILIIGSNSQHLNDAKNMVLKLPSVFGIVIPSDVLFYKLDGTEAIGLLPSDPLFSTGPSLSLECTYMIYSSMQKWVDNTANRGIMADLTIQIEQCIDYVMDKNKIDKWEKNTLRCKIEAFKAHVESENRLDKNAELFFAAMNAVRNTRNTFVHVLSHRPNGKNELAFLEFNITAMKHGRFDLYMRLSSDNSRHFMETVKYSIMLATHARNWVREYAKQYGIFPRTV